MKGDAQKPVGDAKHAIKNWVAADLHRAEHARDRRPQDRRQHVTGPISAAGLARIVAKATGGDVRKVYMYGYLNRVRSSGPFLKPIVKHCEAIN